MTFQSTVNFVRALGVPGEVLFIGPTRAQSAIIHSADAAYNIVGATAYTTTTAASDQDPQTPIIAAAGGTNFFAGILVNPKVYASFGTTGGGPLAPTMTLPNDLNAELLVMGEIVVTVPDACAVGDLPVYDNTTGAISTVPAGSGSAGSGKTFIPNSFVDRYSPTAGGLAVIKLTN